MRILYAKKFDDDIDAIQHDSDTKKRLLEKIQELKQIDSLFDTKKIKKIVGYPGYYRIRIGDYRLGLKLTGDTLELIRFLHRKDIYRRFP